jgi:hypothetical protein
MRGTDGERSPGGSAILRHQPVDREFAQAKSDISTDEVEQHISRYFGTPENVFHEIASDVVHIDIHFVPPASDRDWWTLFTTGMSGLRMSVPEGAQHLARAELILKLPSWWRIETFQESPMSAKDESEWYWPFAQLRWLARLPHEYRTWLSIGHTIPNGDPPTPFAPNTKLCAWLILAPLAESEAQSCTLSDGQIVNVYVVHGLTTDELDLKLKKGTDALVDRFDEVGISEILDPRRESVVPKKRFGVFGR